MKTQTPPSNGNYWKDRYAQTLDELERCKSEWRESARLLGRVISRVATSAIGLDPAIDPQLSKIRTLLRNGWTSDESRAELDEISESLFETVKRPRSENLELASRRGVWVHSGLFAFLQSQMNTSDEVATLAAFQQDVEQGNFVSDAVMFQQLGNVLESVAAGRVSRGEEKGGKHSLIGRLFGAGRKGDKKIDLDAIQGNLIALLEAVDTPLAAQAHANRLLARLRGEMDVGTFLSLLQEVVAFLAELKKDAETAQKSLEEFLADLTRKLIELEQQTVGVQELARATEAGTANLHATFVDHVENLRSSASSATDLDALKRLLSTRLEAISHYVNGEREAELQRIRETERQMAKLTARLQELETETAELRTELRVEHNMAMRDCLTSLPNRMAYNERIEQEVSRWKRFHYPFCLLMWDIDHFKSINDRFGHKAGDKALVAIGEELASSIRETDFVARFGGEEFVMILSGTDRAMAVKVADDIRARVENCGFNSQGKPVRITISCGVSQFEAGDTNETLFERADQCLYRAKNDGRNRCVAD